MDPIVAGVRSEDRVSEHDSGQLELGLNPANLGDFREVVIGENAVCAVLTQKLQLRLGGICMID
jgi:hypothetical protein